jgi:phosphopantothenoylcysteine decarboxylase/phosphopantothenate--cysteine ligase
MSAAPPPGAEALAVEDAESMLAAVVERLPGCAVAIFAAAVANYRMAVRSPEKIKGGERINLELMRTPDIAAWAGAHRDAKDPALLVGFAAESRDLIAAARKKLKDKRLDFIFANAIGKPGQGFDAESNAVALVAPEGKPVESGVMPKRELAEWIWERLIERMPDSKGSSR